MQNILYLSSSGELKGGGQRSLLLLLERLNRGRFNPFLLCQSDGELVEEARKLQIETSVVPFPSLKKLSLFTIIKLVRFIKEKRIDLLHTDGPRNTFYGGMAVKLHPHQSPHLLSSPSRGEEGKERGRRIPLVWHVRVATPDKYLDPFLPSLCTRMITVCKGANSRFSQRARNKIITIYNGIDIEEFNPEIPSKIRDEFHIEKDTILIGTIGRLSLEKGQKELIEAAKEILLEFPGLKFLIAGEGKKEYKNNLIKFANGYRMEKNIIFTGFREDIPEIMKGLDIFVLPSHSEGLSRTILEAMASAKPVIATEVGGNPEAIEDGVTGILVPAKEPDKLAEAILKLVKDREKREEMGIAGRERAEKLFSIEENVRKIEELYQKLRWKM